MSLNDMPELEQIECVKHFGYAIQYIQNPSKEVQLAAVQRCWSNIKYIQNPTKMAQLTGV